MVRVPPKIGCRFSSGCPRRFPCKPGAGITPLRIACRLSGCDRPCVRAVRDVSARRFAGLREGRSADLGEAAELVRVGRARRARGEAPPPHRRSCPRRLGVSYGNRLGDALVLARHAWGLRPPFASPECTDRRVVKKRSQSIKTLLRCRPLLARSSFRRRVRQRSMACRTRADRPGCCSAKRAFVSGGQCGHGLQPADHERIEDGRCGAHRGESPRAIGAPEGEGVAQTQ